MHLWCHSWPDRGFFHLLMSWHYLAVDRRSTLMFPARVLHLSNKSSVENSPSTLILKSSATVGSCSFSTSHKFWEVGFEKRFILSFTTLVNTKSIAERVGAWLCPPSGLVDPGFERPGEVDSGFCHRLSRHSNHDNKKEECYGLYCCPSVVQSHQTKAASSFSQRNSNNSRLQTYHIYNKYVYYSSNDFGDRVPWIIE